MMEKARAMVMRIREAGAEWKEVMVVATMVAEREMLAV